MAYPSFEITILEGNINRGAANEDNVAALVLSSSTVLPPMQPEVIYSVRQAEALGFSEANDLTTGVLYYENIKEFFRMNPNGELHVVTTDPAEGIDTMFGNSSTPGILEPFIIAQNGRIKQLAVMATEADTAWFDDWIVSNDGVAQAQEFCNRLKEQFIFLDVIFLEGHGFNYTPADALDLRAKNAPNVAVVIGGDYDVSVSVAPLLGQGYASVGTVLGSSTNKAIHDSFAWSKADNTLTSGADNRFLKVRYNYDVSSTDLYVDDPSLLSGLHDKGYIFPRRVPFMSGYFWSQSNNCVPITNDINSTELMQVVNKAIRLTGQAIAPFLNRKYRTTPEGRLSPLDRQTITSQIRAILETNMANSVSAFAAIIVDPSLDDNKDAYPPIASDPTLRVILSIQPLGKSEQLRLLVGYVATAQ